MKRSFFMMPSPSCNNNNTTCSGLFCTYNVDICASGWLGVMLSDYIWVSLIMSKYVDWRQRISHWASFLGLVGVFDSLRNSDSTENRLCTTKSLES
jgi:hypothetical protein